LLAASAGLPIDDAVMVFASLGSEVMQPSSMPAKAWPMPVSALMRST
jgi:hypothetical protein